MLFELRIQSFLDGFGFRFWVSPWHQVDLHEGVRFSKRVHLFKLFALDDGELELTSSIIVAQLSNIIISVIDIHCLKRNYLIVDFSQVVLKF